MKKRVRIPVNNPSALLALAKRVKEKHESDGETSLLKPLEWHDLGPLVDATVKFHEDAERFKRSMLESYESRDRGMKTLTTLLRRSRDILTGVKFEQMKALGQWGFDVFDPREVKGETTNENGINGEK